MRMKRNLGVWMDYSSAHLTEFTIGSIEVKVILSKSMYQAESFLKSEKPMYGKEQHEQLEYYKELSEEIKNYDDVVLFGPTDAKVELLNMLRSDKAFDRINVNTKQSDKMTRNQQHVFVREYFHDLSL
jgi:hypothetical protein